MTKKKMNARVAKDLEELFSFVPPGNLKKSVNELFYSFLINNDVLPENYKEIAEDILLLIRFLEKAEDNIKENKQWPGYLKS